MVKKAASAQSGRSYFAWTDQLEEQLIDSLVDLAANNGIENGSFKVGAYNQLEDMMTVKAPSSGIKAYPHIKSRLKVVKSRFQATNYARVRVDGAGMMSRNAL
ncbi:hypothetical protein LINPERPRIM_LOCUS37053 [Linum perenne]